MKPLSNPTELVIRHAPPALFDAQSLHHEEGHGSAVVAMRIWRRKEQAS
jgi:hypothetical protein